MSDMKTKDYMDAVRAAKSLKELKEIQAKYDSIAHEGLPILEKMTDADFERFIAGARMNTRESWAGEEWSNEFGDILFPMIFLPIAVVVHQFQVLESLAIKRLIAVGYFEVKDNGRIFFTEKGLEWWVTGPGMTLEESLEEE